MDIQQHQYVFSRLVKDKDDPLQLLAYAIYKADKSEIAQKLSDNGRDPQQIDHELQTFMMLLFIAEDYSKVIILALLILVRHFLKPLSRGLNYAHGRISLNGLCKSSKQNSHGDIGRSLFPAKG